MQASIFEENNFILQNSTFDLKIPVFIFSSLLVINVARILMENDKMIKSTSSQSQDNQKSHALEDDPNCGIRMGGSDECFWDCEYFDVNEFNSGIDFTEILFKDPMCIEDCFSKNHCIQHLLDDYKSNQGACNGSYGIPDIFLDDQWPASPTQCTFKSSFSYDVIDGLCSSNTEEALKVQDCIIDVHNQRPDILFNIKTLIRSMCNYKIYENFDPRTSRLNPINEINKYPEINLTTSTKVTFQNTKHRHVVK